jgi:fatty acid desaturase
MTDRKYDLDQQLERWENRLPASLARFVRWLRQPSSGFVRIPVACGLILGGFVGFLPILGFWMIPLGLILLARDVPFLRGPIARLLAWIDAKWPAPERAKSD